MPTIIMLASFVVFRQIYLAVTKALGAGFIAVALAYPCGLDHVLRPFDTPVFTQRAGAGRRTVNRRPRLCCERTEWLLMP